MNTDLSAINLAEIVAKDGVILRGGAEKCGPCPKCGGDDRFHVRSFGGRNYFFCRQCHTQRGDAIEYMRWLHGMTFKQAVEGLGAKVDTLTHPAEQIQAEPVELAPATTWQAAMRPLIAECAAYLYGNAPKACAALAYLHNERGLSDATIRAAQIGYNAIGCKCGELWVAEGFTLPGVIFGELWQVRIRRPPAHVGRTFTGKDGRPHKWDKYTGIKGNRQGLMGADAVTRETTAVIVVGGEFDRYLAQQHAPPGVVVVTFGSESKRPHPRWLNMLRNVSNVFITMDNDRAGDAGAALWAALPQARRARVPGSAKDIGEFWQHGGDVAAWLAGVTGVNPTEYPMHEEHLILGWLERAGYEPTYGEDGCIVANRICEEVMTIA